MAGAGRFPLVVRSGLARARGAGRGGIFERGRTGPALILNLRAGGTNEGAGRDIIAARGLGLALFRK